jgi:fructokinase
VGVGIPGAESRASGLIKNANSTCLIGKPLKRDLERRCSAKCASPTTPTVSPCRKPSMARVPGAAVVFGVILGTGVGGGIVVDGKVLKPLGGANAIAGEWGHNPHARRGPR